MAEATQKAQTDGAEITTSSEKEPIPGLTIILPGYSLRNRAWASRTKEEIESIAKGNSLLAHNWKHWEMLEARQKAKAEAEAMGLEEIEPQVLATIPRIPFLPEEEAEAVIKEIGNEVKVNIVAKSVGTWVAMTLLRKIPGRIGKVILCGIPGVDRRTRKFFQESIGTFPVDKILCVQNDKDYVVGYEKARRFLQKVNPAIQIVKMPRADHQYPYPQDFYNFLKP